MGTPIRVRVWVSDCHKKKEAERVYCRAQMDDVTCIFEFEKQTNLFAWGEQRLSRSACKPSQSCSVSGLNQRVAPRAGFAEVLRFTELLCPVGTGDRLLRLSFKKTHQNLPRSTSKGLQNKPLDTWHHLTSKHRNSLYHPHSPKNICGIVAYVCYVFWSCSTHKVSNYDTHRA